VRYSTSILKVIEMNVDISDFDLSVLLVNDPGVGATASDMAIKREVVRQLIYKRANFISTGVKLVGLSTEDNLDVKFSFPSDAAVHYPVPEGSGADLTRVEWAEFAYSLAKAEGRFFITDEAVIRGTDRTQWQTGIRRLGEAMAAEKDNNILQTLYAGALPANTVAATAAWAGATIAQILTDITSCVNNVLNAHGATDADLTNIAIVVPLKAWVGLLRLENVVGTNVQMLQYIVDSYKIDIMPTKNVTAFVAAGGAATDGVALIKGIDTAVHGTLSPPAGIPLVETAREEGVGTEYIVRQFFNTQIVPEQSGQNNTARIARLTGCGV